MTVPCSVVEATRAHIRSRDHELCRRLEAAFNTLQELSKFAGQLEDFRKEVQEVNAFLTTNGFDPLVIPSGALTHNTAEMLKVAARLAAHLESALPGKPGGNAP